MIKVGQLCHYYPPPADVMDNRHWPCDVLEMRGKSSARVLMFTDESPDGIERTVPIRRLISGQSVIFDEEAKCSTPR